MTVVFEASPANITVSGLTGMKKSVARNHRNT
jgi:hypothetical protein